MLNDDIAVERSLRDSAAQTARSGSVPVIDMSLDDVTVAQQMWDAATTVGFFSVVNHGVSKTTIDSAFASSSALFARELDDKRQEMPFAAHLNSGYEFMSQVRPSTGTADQKESLQITARTGCMDGRWPTTPVALEPVARSLLDASHALASRILSLLEPRACPSVKPGTLAGSHRLWSDDGQCTLRLLHYPPTAPPDDQPTGPPLWRAGAHTDWCCVTLLYQLPGNEGLECAANPRVGAAHTGWLTVDPLEGAIAVNIGDMLSRWSDGRLLSNLHRVRMPTAAECNPPKSRYSIAFFMQADKGAVIASDTHETITAGEYILGRIKSNFEQSFKSNSGAVAGSGSSGGQTGEDAPAALAETGKQSHAPSIPTPVGEPAVFVRKTKAEKKALRAERAVEKKRMWRERQKESQHAAVAARAADREKRLAAMEATELAAFEAAEKLERDRLYQEKVAQSKRVDEALTSGVRVALDLSYGDRMSAKEQTSLARQLSRCWGANRRAKAPVALHLAGLGACPPECLPLGDVIEKWKVHRLSADVVEAFPNEQLVFLSPDADEPLTALEPQCVYIIGGLVDSSVQKHTSLQKAHRLGARVMRLPLAEHSPATNPRLPLTLTAVLGILLAVNEGADWPTALRSAVAPRLLRASNWENGRAARRKDQRERAAASWGDKARAPPGSTHDGKDGGDEDEDDLDSEEDEAPMEGDSPAEDEGATDA